MPRGEEGEEAAVVEVEGAEEGAENRAESPRGGTPGYRRWDQDRERAEGWGSEGSGVEG